MCQWCEKCHDNKSCIPLFYQPWLTPCVVTMVTRRGSPWPTSSWCAPCTPPAGCWCCATCWSRHAASPCKHTNTQTLACKTWVISFIFMHRSTEGYNPYNLFNLTTDYSKNFNTTHLLIIEHMVMFVVKSFYIQIIGQFMDLSIMAIRTNIW